MLRKEDVIEALKKCYDPEIPVNVYDLGLIYKLDIVGDNVSIVMTLTSPFCPIIDPLLDQIKEEIKKIGAEKVDIDLTFDPPWNKDMMSEEAREELGL
ncbi:MAG: iron-sulfur cluster assembly protein [Candidatus Parvarchaeota archaeon]|nr:iron-sulfur cluster assembly protein [Candidatus Parvarchaeota archaeon]MCW1301781.1 iron-sulfur cluster assembly protein [Candidatus Parvarchaeota archaeon]